MAADGFAIDPDITGVYDVTKHPSIAQLNWDFTTVTLRGWVAPNAPVTFSSNTMSPGLTANTYATAAPGGSDSTSQSWSMSTPIMTAAKIKSIAITFGGTFASETATISLTPIYDPMGPLATPILVNATAAGVQSLSAAQLAFLATNKNSSLIAFIVQMKSTISNSAVTAVVAFATS